MGKRRYVNHSCTEWGGTGARGGEGVGQSEDEGVKGVKGVEVEPQGFRSMSMRGLTLDD